MISQYDKLEIRCPMLGHSLHFSYCRSTVGENPCRRIFDCWFQRFPVQDFMQKHFSKEILDKLSAPPKAKMLSLIELIEQAKKNNVYSDKTENC